MADCEEIGHLLDAYALGAVEAEDTGPIEEHLAECLACWEHLTEAQRAAALLALAVPLEQPRERLRQRILAQAQKEGARKAVRWKATVGVRRMLPVAAGVLAAIAVASLSWSLVLQRQTDDLRQDYSALQQQASTSQELMGHQRQLLALLVTPDVQSVDLTASGVAAGAVATYMWSPSSSAGAIVGNKLPSAPEGMVYQLWFFRPDGVWVDGGTFQAVDGIGHHAAKLEAWDEDFTAVGVTVEPAGGSAIPTAEPVLFAHLPYSSSP